ncbi:MAG: aldo/keto reductase [Leptospiraceae bacterium]|nr:aldo/keto reductase [Leptospiraceae bacterium]MDW7976875.1 aldo/keto reductase [Leptospiraceae bacterium]
MKHKRLGRSPIFVSQLCLGTMTFGSFVSEEESFRILDKAYDFGINFFDTAEIYPVPPDEKWVFRTEEILGKWFRTKPRDSIIIATKVSGPSHGWFVPPVRSGLTTLDQHHITKAIEGSLKRLQTDYIDLYQIHWNDPRADHEAYYYEILSSLTKLKEQGKIRIAGCSNETPWGLMKSLWVSDKYHLIRYETIQNNYSILNRRFEDSLAEISRKEQVSLLPYSPLAGGVTTGKYNQENPPENARFSIYKNMGERQKRQVKKYINEKTLETVNRLKPIAEKLNISTTTLSIAWILQQDFVASVIFGVTNSEQLDEIFSATEIKLDKEILKEIDQISNDIMYPLG